MIKCRKNRTRISKVSGEREEYSIIWGMFMAGKNFQNNQNLTLKKMFDISTKVVSEQDEILKFGNDSLGKTFMEISVINC